MVRPFLRWLDGEGVRRFDDLNVGLVRTYRAQLAARPSQYGRPLQPKTILESHRAILCFLRWARREGYPIDGRILDLVPPKVPLKDQPSTTSPSCARCSKRATRPCPRRHW